MINFGNAYSGARTCLSNRLRSSSKTLPPTAGRWEVAEAGALAPDLEGVEGGGVGARRGEDEEAAGKHGN